MTSKRSNVLARRLRPRSRGSNRKQATTRRVDRSVTSQTQSPPRERFRFTPPVVSTSLVFSASLPPAVDLSVLHAAFQSGRRLAGDIENLDLYYQDCVIGGPGAFIVPVREARHFAEAVRTKLVREIAGVLEPEPLIKPAQERERMNCLIGEIMRRQRFGP